METLEQGQYNIGTFCIDVTPPIGHALCGGLVEPASGVRDPLTARGFVVSGCDEPLVVVVFDWCELRNDAYYRVREMIAESVETLPDRVMISTVHPHDAPIFDLYAERLLHERGIAGLFCDPDFFEECMSRVALAARNAMTAAVPLTDICIGQAKVEKIASNRRIPGRGVTLKAWRGSSVQANSGLMDEPEGLVDPLLKLLVLKSGSHSVAALCCYATHPMSFYGTGMISSDFYGDARRIFEIEHPETLVIYTNGCGGNIAPGKYNDGTEDSRQAMAGRLAEAMQTAWDSTQQTPIGSVAFQKSQVDFRTHIPDGFLEEVFNQELSSLPSSADRSYLEKIMKTELEKYIDFWNAVEGLSWLKNLEENGPTAVTCLTLNNVKMLMLPGETFIQYQLAAQQLRPDAFVMVSAYGDCGMGYIPVDSAWGEGGYEENESYLAPGVEMPMIQAIADILNTSTVGYTPTQARQLPRVYRKWPYKKNLWERGMSRILKILHYHN